ncbi:hypothetical protein [Pseudonocardia lacus]|uniref:hypothetical protein n=1 Tax=Pseudonocardia lacus TaxID=2835865 RepID=UPI0027E38295|nr:hypothetical protein [Pseudonocardia lacus]
MARHRSPEGRRPHQPPLSVAYDHPTDGGRGTHRSSNTPLRRGATAIAVAGGALSLVGAGVPVVVQSLHDANTTDGSPYRSAAYNALSVSSAPTDDTVVEPAAQAPLAPLVAPTVQPVAWTPEPDVTNGAALVKAVQMVEQQVAAQAEADRVAAEQAVAEQAAEAERVAAEDVRGATGSPDCGLSTSGLGAVKSHVRNAAEFLGCQYGEPDMHGVAGRAGTSDHPGGLALDFMVDRSTGDRLAQCALDNQEALGVKYVIWEQQINHGNGWKQMEDRGGATANHFDHVHVSFDSGAGSGDLSGC